MRRTMARECMLRQSANSQISKRHDAFGIVRLQRKRPFAQSPLKRIAERLRVLIFREIDGDLVVDFDRDVPPLHLDVCLIPFVVLDHTFEIFRTHVNDAVQASGFFWVFMSDIHLAFVAVLWPAFFLNFCVEVDPRIAAWRRHGLTLKLEIPERLVVANVKQVAALARALQISVGDVPRIQMFCLLPAVKSFAVVHRVPAVRVFVLGIGRANPNSSQRYQHNSSKH